MDLSPRPVEAAPRPKRRGPKPAVIVLIVVLVAGGFVLVKGLTNAINYYCNVDELGTKSGCETDKRIRLQGLVDQGSLKELPGSASFTLSFNGATVPVLYSPKGKNPVSGIFQECIAVVVYGTLHDGVFQGDDLEVKHSNEYREDNGTRLDETASESAACSLSA